MARRVSGGGRERPVRRHRRAGAGAARSTRPPSRETRAGSVPADRRSTGVPALDRELDGGVPTGCVVALTADPASQSELFVHAFAAVHETQYLTTVRTADSVARWLEEPTTDEATPTQILETTERDDVIASTRRGIQSIPRGGAVVIDSAGPLEAVTPSRYRSLLASLSDAVVEADGVGLIHALTAGGARSRCRLLTEQVADVVVRLETTVTDVAVENRLVVPKARGIGALDAPIKLALTDAVVVDTSRDIA
ncbi:RAD55 family ATPase [Halorubrum sp. SY-15]|uniref:RAD55 family ATPase n=1 Tax=Halorubrum sp. SY-15 TaxID=3402277 RepID=UPI003EB893DB